MNPPVISYNLKKLSTFLTSSSEIDKENAQGSIESKTQAKTTLTI